MPSIVIRLVASSRFSPVLLLNRPDPVMFNCSVPDMTYLNLRILGAELIPVTSDMATSLVLNSDDCGFIVLAMQEGVSGSVDTGKVAQLGKGDVLVFSGKRAGYVSPAIDPADVDRVLCIDKSSDVATPVCNLPLENILAIVLKAQLCEIVKGRLGDSLPPYTLLTPSVSKSSYILSIGEQLAKISNDSSDINKAKVARFTELLLIEILDLFLSLDSAASRLLQGGKDLRISAAIKAVHAKPEFNWTVSGLAAIANMSRSLFASRFKETYGETPLNYVKQCRIHRAKILLTETIAPIDQIADQCGYNSQSAFIKAFSAAIGLSPGRWRSVQKNQLSA